MKKLLTVLSIAAIMATTAAPAEAGKKTNYILGGVLGGLVLGGILHNNAQAAPAPQPVYVQPQPIYEQRCWNEARSQWNSYRGGYVTYYVKRCETYRIN